MQHNVDVDVDIPTARTTKPAFATSNLRAVISEPVRIKTRTPCLSSGFAYTQLLFDLRISPTEWDQFSADVVAATKLNGRDEAAIISTIAGFSLVGLAGFGILFGEKVKDKRKLKRILANREEGGVLAKVLNSWNQNYFNGFGVKVWVEVNEKALQEQARKNGTEPPEFVSRKRTSMVRMREEDYKRRREEKKYMVVVSPLDRNDEVAGLKGMEEEGELIDLSEEPLLSKQHVGNPFADPPEIRRDQIW